MDFGLTAGVGAGAGVGGRSLLLTSYRGVWAGAYWF